MENKNGSFACPLASQSAMGVLSLTYFLDAFNDAGLAFFAFRAQGRADGIGDARVFNACGAAALVMTREEYYATEGEGARCRAEINTTVNKCPVLRSFYTRSSR